MFISLGHRPQSKSTLRSRLAIASLLIASYVLTPEASTADTSSLTLEDAVELALTHNPGLAALDAQSDALGAVPPQAGALPDPILSLNAMNLPSDTFDFDQEPMTQLQVGVSQSIPFLGKRKLQRVAAENESRAAEALAAERRDALRGSVRSAWWRLFNFDRALGIVEQNQGLMRDFIEIAQTKYTVGNGLQQDVLLAQLELSRLMDREARLRGRRKNAEAVLNALLNRPPEQAITLSRTPPNDKLPELPVQARLLEEASETRHLLQVHHEALAAADARLDLAQRDRYPDFRLGAAYGFRQGNDPVRGDRADLVSVMLSANVPLYFGRKQGKAIEQRGHERSQQQYALSDAARMIEAEIARSTADYEAAREQVLLLDTAIIPQARQTVASMLAAYQVNEVDFLNVVNGQLMLYNAQISYWEALSEAKQSLARLAAAVGKETLYE